MPIFFPVLSIIFCLIYARMYQKRKTLSCLFTAVAWLVYAVYEYLMYARILCSGECNIRVDLLLIYPVLLVCSILAIVLYFRKKCA